ncbi:MAG: VCBS repeat-containing protein [Verrucomicrobiota bacterium]
MNRYLVMVLAIVTLLVSTHSRGQADLPPLVAARCAGCHPAPRATSMPRHAWPKIIDSMEEVMAAQGQPLLSLEKRFISEYYIQNSNPALSNIPDEFADSGIPFQSIAVGLPSRDVRPQVTSTKVADLDGDGQRDDLILTDNTRSSVSWLRVEGGEWFETEIANAPAPVNTTPFDFDNDGDIDLAVSAMGCVHP